MNGFTSVPVIAAYRFFESFLLPVFFFVLVLDFLFILLLHLFSTLPTFFPSPFKSIVRFSWSQGLENCNPPLANFHYRHEYTPYLGRRWFNYLWASDRALPFVASIPFCAVGRLMGGLCVGCTVAGVKCQVRAASPLRASVL